MKKDLKTFYADISWLCIPWEEIKIYKHGGKQFITGIEYRPDPDDPNCSFLSFNPAKQNPMFWQDVRQWYLFFANNSVDKVQGYYRLYGPLRVTPHSLVNSDKVLRKELTDNYGESWEATEAALGWFNLLTCMTDWIKNGRIGPLWELFGKPREIGDPAIRIFPDPKQRIGTDSRFGFYSIYWRAVVPIKPEGGSSPNFRWTTPQNDEQVLQSAWRVIVDEVNKLMNEIQFSSASIDELNMPSLTWDYIPSGAFQAAFLQWYFQELAGFEVVKCKKYGCENAVPPGRKKYCSQRCYAAAAKQRQRIKKNREV